MSRVSRRLPGIASQYIFLHSTKIAAEAARNSQGVHKPLDRASTIFSTFERLDSCRFRNEVLNNPNGQQPTLISKALDAEANTGALSELPAIHKWFQPRNEFLPGTQSTQSDHYFIQWEYMSKFKDVILPYELLSPQIYSVDGNDVVYSFREHLKLQHPELLPYIPPNVGITKCVNDEKAAQVYDESDDISMEGSQFHRFNAPLGLLLEAARSRRLGYLYIAQAQLADLPEELRDDLPTPKIVLEGGKGDIYGANLWMGTAPTYTPLHKDPNPNLFVQLANNKLVRLFSPTVGQGIFHAVQQKIGRNGSAAFRGEEMMHGDEAEELENAVWDCPPETHGCEVLVRPGDALFIPKGWWHSVKSVNLGISASVNWWFR